MADIYESGENYLETILILKNSKGYLRSIDIVRQMQLSKPSVSRAVNTLKDKGYITVSKDGLIELTDTGNEIANTIYERHQVLTSWLVSIGVDEETAATDACRIEHAISTESFSKLKQHMKKFHNKTVIE